MREIKFRGKTIPTEAYPKSEWIYGYYLEKELCDGNGRCSYIKYDGNSEVRIIPETVGQFTGLHDKNGKEIYEGDIVCSMTSVGDIQFDYGVFGIEWTHNKETKSMKGAWGQKHNLRKMDDGFNNDIEIIGNIHDNKELLNRK